MARNRRVIRDATPQDVFAVLRDGRTYGDWVVGTGATEEVDPQWPEPGTALHWRIGHRPLRKDDQTVSRAYQPDRLLRLEAQAWPFGTARIVLQVEPVDGGVAVVIDENPERGLLKLLHNPGLDALIKVRNVETLRRLEKQVRAKQADRPS